MRVRGRWAYRSSLIVVRGVGVGDWGVDGGRAVGRSIPPPYTYATPRLWCIASTDRSIDRSIKTNRRSQHALHPPLSPSSTSDPRTYIYPHIGHEHVFTLRGATNPCAAPASSRRQAAAALATIVLLGLLCLGGRVRGEWYGWGGVDPRGVTGWPGWMMMCNDVYFSATPAGPKRRRGDRSNPHDRSIDSINGSIDASSGTKRGPCVCVRERPNQAARADRPTNKASNPFRAANATEQASSYPSSFLPLLSFAQPQARPSPRALALLCGGVGWDGVALSDRLID